MIMGRAIGLFFYSGLMVLLGYWWRAGWWANPSDGVTLTLVLLIALATGVGLTLADSQS